MGVAVSAALVLLGSGPGAALPEPDVGPRDSIAQEADWLVVKQADSSGCHLAPAVRPWPSQLEFLVRGDSVPVLLTPYKRGFKGYVIFTVDKRPPLFLAATLVEDPEHFVLPETILRDLKAGLRDAGQLGGGPAAFTPQDRSRFLQALEAAVQGTGRRR